MRTGAIKSAANLVKVEVTGPGGHPRLRGAGRATCDSSDYSSVLVLSRELVNFCSDAAVQVALHSKLRAEIAFRLECSTGVSAAETRENLGHFRAQNA